MKETTVNTMYWQLLKMVTRAVTIHVRRAVTPEVVKRFVQAFKRVVVNAFSEHCRKGLFTLTFHLLDHMAEDINRFRSAHVLVFSLLDHFNVTIKQLYRTTSLIDGTRTKETVKTWSSHGANDYGCRNCKKHRRVLICR